MFVDHTQRFPLQMQDFLVLSTLLPSCTKLLRFSKAFLLDQKRPVTVWGHLLRGCETAMARPVQGSKHTSTCRQTCAHTHTQRHAHTHTHRDMRTHTHTHRETCTHTHRDTHRHTQTDRHTHTHRHRRCLCRNPVVTRSMPGTLHHAGIGLPVRGQSPRAHAGPMPASLQKEATQRCPVASLC